MPLRFAKLEAAGNDLVLLDARQGLHHAPPDLARELCDRHFGIGGDGLLILQEGPEGLPLVRMFNPDGSEDFCGNGMRCVAAWLYSHGEAHGARLTLASPRGRHHAEVTRSGPDLFAVEVELLAPDFDPKAIPAATPLPRLVEFPLEIQGRKWPVSAVSLGTAHAAVFTDRPVDDATFRAVSPAIETHPIFPERASVLWCVAERPDRVLMRVWERGVGETLSCGTGTCAAVAIGNVLGRTAGRAEVVTRGGTMTARWDGRGPARLTGPARIVYTGVFRRR